MNCINNLDKKCSCNKITCKNTYNNSDYLIGYKEYQQNWDMES